MITTHLHPEEIKAKVRMKGKSLADLARENDVHVTTVQKALYTPSPKGEIIIASFLEVPTYQLWPDRWTIYGKRIRPRYAYKYNKV